MELIMKQIIDRVNSQSKNEMTLCGLINVSVQNKSMHNDGLMSQSTIFQSC